MGKRYTSEKLKKMQQALEEAYRGKGMTPIDTAGQTLDEVIRGIARIVYLEEYKPADLRSKLRRVSRR